MVGALKKLVDAFWDRENNGPTNAELDDLAYHSKFSDFLPYLAYDPKTAAYHNADGTIGFLWECTPLVFSADKSLQISEAFTRLPLPSMSVLQFNFHGDENIKPFLEAYRSLRANSDDPLVHDAVESYCDFLQACTNGIPQLSNIPLRNIRLLVSLKMPVGADVKPADIQSTVRQTLKSMHLAPRNMNPPALLQWLRRLLNDSVPEARTKDGRELAATYNDTLPISKQAIYAETAISVEDSHIEIGERFWKCITPKTYPQDVDPLQTKELFGGIWGVRSDNDQHRVPFLYSLNIIYDKSIKGHLRNKCDLILAQSAAGSFARSLQRKQEEHKWGIDLIDQGKIFARVMPSLWFIGRSYEEVDHAMKQGKTMWEAAGYTMQEETRIQTAMLLNSLPMGLRASKHNLNMLERDIIADPDSICNILPIQGDFSGSREAVMLLQGRSGQIAPLSIFSKKANNYNGFCAGTSGGGKSFAINNLIFSQYTADTDVRIIDIGRSYERQCHIFNGDYIQFNSGYRVNMNPFTNIRTDEKDDLEGDLSAATAIHIQMAYSSSEAPVIDELEWKIMADAVNWAFEQKQNDASPEDVYEYLVEFPKYLAESKKSTARIVELAHHLAFNIHTFAHGPYRDYFVGRSTFNIKNSKFVLLELDALKEKKDLFKVITLSVLDAVTKDLYLSDRSRHKMVLFEEAYQFLSGANGNKMIAEIIEQGFRRARKYGGSFLIVTQSILDRKLFGEIGDIIWSNADYKILLPSEDFDKSLAEKLISYDPFTIELLNTVQKNETNYSEMYVDTPYGSGIVRLAVPPFVYYLFTSNAKEIAEMEAMVKDGMTYREAIHEMVRKYRPEITYKLAA